MIICHSNRYIFVHIHKTGGSSIEMALEPTLQWQDILLGSTTFGEQANRHFSQRFGITKHSSISDIYALRASTNLRTYQVLGVVRHPLHRAVSLFNFMAGIIEHIGLITKLTPSELRQRRASLSADHRQLSWPSSIAYLESEGNFDAFVHNPNLDRARAFCSQYSQLSINEKLVDKLTVLRTEELAGERAKAFLEAFTGASTPIPHANRSNKIMLKPDTVSNKARIALESRFLVDYNTFGYA
ncbi:sulfotransferase family 2 domain-containing protein [Cyanobium sp. LEGE 06143]|uniref:sulfotransferase family 2 domain-containing protein n=1 Tax=Cyanobium sp. LEGE 06143 TaxID=945727 RepID=UPI001D133DCF|nr:sulfotransferase family 2 domain-containing protein [Cyanobium sp. LEGE 06143]